MGFFYQLHETQMMMLIFCIFCGTDNFFSCLIFHQMQLTVVFCLFSRDYQTPLQASV